MKARKLDHRVAFDREVLVPDGRGGQNRTWQELTTCWAEFRYQRGKEAMAPGALTGSATWKVRVRASSQLLNLTTACRMRDVRQGISFNIREIDPISDPGNIWLSVESGVAI